MKIRPKAAALEFLRLAAVFSLLLAGPAVADTPERDQEEVVSAALEPMLGDLDAIAERGMLRMAIPYNPIYFSYDNGEIIGFAVERAREFEAFLNKREGRHIDVILLPLPRDEIISAVIEGRADIASANLTITPERAELVAFSDPILKDVSELVVTGPAAGPVSTFDDLAGVGLFLRPSSSYYGHLEDLNALRVKEGKPPIPVTDVDERLEDYDLLEMLRAGLIPAIVVDDHKLDLWQQVFDKIVVHEDLVLNKGGDIAWALRKDSPQLMAAVNGFIANIKEGTLIGNVLLNRYLGSSDWIEDIREGRSLSAYEDIVSVIKGHAESFGFDWRMILAQAYQESKLDHSQVSGAGAVGIMQILPSTAGDPNVNIKDIDDLEKNVHAGVKYLRFLRERYFDKPKISPLDEVLFSLAAYNAGPGNIAKARALATKMGLDPDVWFSNVEVAAARSISREPVIYVRNIYKYYVSLSLLTQREPEAAQEATLEAVAQPDGPKVASRPAGDPGQRPSKGTSAQSASDSRAGTWLWILLVLVLGTVPLIVIVYRRKGRQVET